MWATQRPGCPLEGAHLERRAPFTPQSRPWDESLDDLDLPEVQVQSLSRGHRTRTSLPCAVHTAVMGPSTATGGALQALCPFPRRPRTRDSPGEL